MIIHYNQVGLILKKQACFIIYKSMNIIYYMKKLRHIKHISLGAKKAYDKTQHYFTTKVLLRVGIQ